MSLFTSSVSGCGSGNEKGNSKPRSIFEHPESSIFSSHGSVFKPTESVTKPTTSSPPRDSIFASKTTSLFTSGPSGASSKSPFLPAEPASAVPLFSFTTQQTSDLGQKGGPGSRAEAPKIPTFSFAPQQNPDPDQKSGASASGSQPQTLNPLARDMANLEERLSRVQVGERAATSLENQLIKFEAGFHAAASLGGAPQSGGFRTAGPNAQGAAKAGGAWGLNGMGTANGVDNTLAAHLGLLRPSTQLDELKEITTTPIFTEAVRKHALSLVGASSETPFSQYGLLAGDLAGAGDATSDRRIFWNIAAPSSFFICGSQGSGKSHTLSCLLENALAPCKANVLPRPLTGIVFHYDTFISDSGGSPCEAAWLSTNPDIKVRVLCAPTNIRTMQRIYERFPNIAVEELRLNEADLNTKRMLDLMAVTTGGNLPLYLHVAQRILRDLRVQQQRTDTGFSYTAFKRSLQREELTEMQLAPLKQRLETLESFMVESQAKAYNMFGGAPAPSRARKPGGGTSWAPRNGHLTIVDLSCPCVTPEMACSLFNICLSLFLEQDSAAVGRVVALDEAHKYMTESHECAALTEALLATIRLQRHLGARVIISTQEPTISPKLLDLCSVTVVHRFTSPDWLHALKRHLAGVSSGGRLLEKAQRLREDKDDADDGAVDGAGALALGDADPALELFSRIVDLRVGEALLFAPSAVVGVRRRKDGADAADAADAAGRAGDVKRLAHGVLKVRIRNRITKDGGQSIMAA